MKNLIWVIVIAAIAAGILLEMRYEFFIDSPVVAKFDRLTGDAWIVNSGVWRKIQSLPEQQDAQLPPPATPVKTK